MMPGYIRLRSLVVVALLVGLGFAAPAGAVELLDSGTGRDSVVNVTSFQYFAQPFSLNQDVANAQFIFDLRRTLPQTNSTTHGVISTAIGPGTTQDDVLAEFEIPIISATNNVSTTVLDLDAIAAGDYYISFGIESGFTNLFGPAFRLGAATSNEFGSVGSGQKASIPSRNSLQLEASTFGPLNASVPTLALDMVINGDITETPPGIPGGNETFFNFDPPAIDGVGVTVADLGAEHGNDSQSVAGTSDTTMSTLTRTFGFDSADTDATSVDVYIHAILEGDLFADNFSSASARGMFEILDSDDNVVGMDSAFVDVNALGGELATANVFEVLTLAASLTPGETYAIESRLTLMTEAGLNGAARALFADTFAYEISGLSENPFGEPGSGTTFGIPEPGTFALGMFGLLALGIFGRRRRRRA